MEITSLLTPHLGASFLAGDVPFLFLADIIVDTSVGTWLLGGAFVLSIALALAKIYDVFRRRPPIDAEFATKKELNGLRSETRNTDNEIFKAIENLRLEVKADVQELNRADEARSSKIHTRMDSLAESFSEVKGAVTAELRTLPCRTTGRCPT